MALVRTQRDPQLFGPHVLRCVQSPIQVSPPSRDVFSYVGVRMSLVGLRQDRSQGSTYVLASLEGEGLPVPPMVRK